MSYDLDRHIASIQYGKTFVPVVGGTNYAPIADYPDKSDNSVLQWVFDTLDKDQLWNDLLFEEIQQLLDLWLIEEITPQQARAQLLELLVDHFDFGC